MTAFKTIRERAERRKGAAQLKALLPQSPRREALLALADDRALAEMTKRVFCAGFSWSVIETKWPGFEAAFLSFNPAQLLFQPDEFWERLGADTRIVRYPAKILSVRKNARFVQDIAREHGSFGKFLHRWPADDEIGLLALLAKRGDRLGGHSGQMLLRYLGWDAFVTSKDVVACLRDAGLDIADTPTSKRDLAAIQQQFNAWGRRPACPTRIFRASARCRWGRTLARRRSRTGRRRRRRNWARADRTPAV